MTTQTTTETSPAQKTQAARSPMAVIRAAFPSLRRSGPTAIVHSGGRQTVFGCLCGATHTTSTDYRGRSALHVSEWERAHSGCAAALLTRISDGEIPHLARRWNGARVGGTMPVVEFAARGEPLAAIDLSHSSSAPEVE